MRAPSCLSAALATAALILAASAAPATAQANGPAIGTEALRARRTLALYLRQGLRQRYVAEQTTRLLTGRVRESRQIVKHAGPGRERIEYVSPPRMKGEVILIAGGHMLHYKPAPIDRVLEGPAPLEAILTRARELLAGVRTGRVTVREVGEQVVAGQNARIVEIRTAQGRAFKRLWIDGQTGVRLRQETVSPRGDVVSTSYFTRIDYDAPLDPGEFAPGSLPKAPREALLPARPPLDSVEAAQPLVAYTIRQPRPPPGFALRGVWVTGSRPLQTVILRYSDAVNSFTLFQRPRPVGPGAGRALPERPRVRAGAAQWASGDRVFTLVGALRPDLMRRIAGSLP
ncbi:MAG: hypothetical protein IT208_01915 [Chthonomonadales bacterium]|nr:hypothetical protein [Chthonomonadales bacterium]